MKRINLNLDFNTDDEPDKINISLNKETKNIQEELKEDVKKETDLINDLLPKNNTQRMFALSIVTQLIFNSLKND